MVMNSGERAAACLWESYYPTGFGGLIVRQLSGLAVFGMHIM